MGSSQRGIIDLVVTDFDRTLGRLFPQRDHERDVYEDVWRMYADHDLPRDVRAAAGGSPYSLWTTAYKWMEERIGRSDAEAVYQTVAERLTHHELDAAESLLLFDGVRLTLERMRASGIPVAVVSNNSTEAVERALKVNKVEGLVQTVAGRQPGTGMQELKPRPALVLRALDRCRCAADRAVMVGDDLIDIIAARAAGIHRTIGLHRHSTVSQFALWRVGAWRVLDGFRDVESVVLDGVASSRTIS